MFKRIGLAAVSAALVLGMVGGAADARSPIRPSRTVRVAQIATVILIGPSAPRIGDRVFGGYDAFVVADVANVLEVGRHTYRGTTVRGRTFAFTLDINAARTKITFISAGRPVTRIAWIANDLDGNDLLWWSGNAPNGYIIQDENGSVIEKLEFEIPA